VTPPRDSAFGSLFHNDHTVMLLVDPEAGRIVDANAAAVRFYGWSRQSLQARSWLDVAVASGSGPAVPITRERPLDGAEFASVHRRADGSERDVRIALGRVAVDGRELRYALVRDVTEPAGAPPLQRLRDHALDVVAQALVLTDREGRVLWCNQAFTRLTGYGPDEAIGARPGDLVRSGLQDDAFYDELWRTIQAGVPWRGRLVNRRKDGTLYDEEMVISPVVGEAGTVTHFVAAKRDVTAEARRERELKRWETVFRSLKVGVALSDADGTRLAMLNDAYATIQGVDAADLIGTPILDRFADAERARIAAHLADAERHGSATYEAERTRPDGSSIPTLTTVSRVDPGSGLDARFIATVQDMTRMRETEARLEGERMRTALASQTASLGFWTHDLRSGTFEIADAWKRHLGYAPGDVADDLAGFAGLLHPDDAAAVLERLRAFQADPSTGYRNECRLLGADGRVHRVLSQATVERDANGRPAVIHGIDVDVTELRSLSERVDALTFFDPLTGLPNRNGARRALARHLASAPEPSRRTGVLVLGLDGFRSVNDSLGHDAGDEVLRGVATRLSGLRRGYEVLGRYTGDRFVVAFGRDADLTVLDDAVRSAQRTVSAPFEVQGHAVHLGCSVGVAIAPDDGRAAADLLAHAETALHAAKEAGAGTVRYYSSQLDRLAVERMTLRSELSGALARDEIELHFQPQARLGDGSLFGVEALARWTHPVWGPVAPDRFVPEAERSGQIVALGSAVRRKALEQLRRWRRTGIACARIAVNVSARELEEEGWLASVLSDLSALDLSPGDLEIEITETTAMTVTASVRGALQTLRGMGARVAIDDFGTGYASLGQLQRLNADVLKIDRTFVDRLDAEGSHGDRELIRAMLQLAGAFDLDTIAEGVETETQRAFLASSGCTAAQGYLFAKPLPGEAIEPWLRGHGTLAG